MKISFKQPLDGVVLPKQSLMQWTRVLKIEFDTSLTWTLFWLFIRQKQIQTIEYGINDTIRIKSKDFLVMI